MRVCLIHGSTQSPHGWDLLVHELMAWGADVTAVDLPREHQGARFFAQEVARQMPAGESPVVVAHSAAGLILPLVAEYMEVTRLVYLAAVIPKPESSFVGQFNESSEMFQPGWLGKDPTKDHQAARHFLFHDCDQRVQEWALTTLRLWTSPPLLQEDCPLRSFQPIPTTYISSTKDRTINPEWWERAAQRSLGLEPVRIDAGHAPHVSRPREVARLIIGPLHPGGAVKRPPKVPAGH